MAKTVWTFMEEKPDDEAAAAAVAAGALSGMTEETVDARTNARRELAEGLGGRGLVDDWSRKDGSCIGNCHAGCRDEEHLWMGQRLASLLRF